MRVTQACLPLLREAQGRIVNISSVSGRIAVPLLGPYTASKFAVEALSDALRRELTPWGMHVVVVQPGPIRTPIWEKSTKDADVFVSELSTPVHAAYATAIQRLRARSRRFTQRARDPEEVARTVLHALTVRNPRTRYPIGWEGHVTTLLARIIPDRLLDMALALRERS